MVPLGVGARTRGGGGRDSALLAIHQLLFLLFVLVGAVRSPQKGWNILLRERFQQEAEC